MSLLISVAASVAVLVATADLSATGLQAQDTTQFLRLEQMWNEAHLRGDADALDRLWADDLVVTVPGMSPMTKATSLGFARSGRMRFERYETADLAVQVHGDAAVVTGRLWRTRTLGETTVDDDWRFTKVYVRAEGTWRVVAFHASPASQ